MKCSQQISKSINACSRILLLLIFLIGLPTVAVLGAQSTHNTTTTRAILSPEFTGSPTSGFAPLQVQFSDQSTGTPTGYTWYFVDEDFSKSWELRSGAPWIPRQGHTSVALPDGSIILMGGFDGVNQRNDVWLLTNWEAN